MSVELTRSRIRDMTWLWDEASDATIMHPVSHMPYNPKEELVSLLQADRRTVVSRVRKQKAVASTGVKKRQRQKAHVTKAKAALSKLSDEQKQALLLELEGKENA